MNEYQAEQTIQKYLKPIFRFALKRCKTRQDAEDLSQEIVLGAHQLCQQKSYGNDCKLHKQREEQKLPGGGECLLGKIGNEFSHYQRGNKGKAFQLGKGFVCLFRDHLAFGKHESECHKEPQNRHLPQGGLQQDIFKHNMFPSYKNQNAKSIY